MNTQSSNTIDLTRANVHHSQVRHPLTAAASPVRQQKICSDSLGVFEQFLCWLGPDAEAAGRKYESIRSRLIMMFKARRCVFAEDLADATIERVARKMNYLPIGFTGDPALYFYGVAKKIYLEHQRKIAFDHKKSHTLQSIGTDNPDLENMLNQLDEALSTISKSDRELILKYYSSGEKNRINRQALAQQFGIGTNALRIRVFRIRKAIKNYILQSGTDACKDDHDANDQEQPTDN
jgi:DNA-directed RNA polymerase specialized sigma24 family protein